MPAKSDQPSIQDLVSDRSARGIELCATPVVFGAFGWFLDGRLGTGPWIAVALAAFALFGTATTMWYRYDAEMRELESSGRWARRAAPPAAPAADHDLWADREASQP